ncbi:MAG: hypothetical protein NPIRA02_22950 [Nitrospirales bacterium]|nr:MAG: hypothetical protein NPIRA02_22950 [Nitrospirales bacterium]
MPTNALKKDTPRGNGPPPVLTTTKQASGKNDAQTESELAAQEIEALWESQEVGLTRWSTDDGKRYAD